jgi:phosphoenolpyruvate-protein kinase (PTS system EI component)
MTELVRAAPALRPESAESVAFALMELIFFNEVAKPAREEILATYADCLKTVRGEPVEERTRSVGVVAAALA